MEGKLRHRQIDSSAARLERLSKIFSQSVVAAWSIISGGRENATTDISDQRCHPRDQVAEVVRQIGVEPPDEGLLREVGVEAEDHLAQDEVAEGVVALLPLERHPLDQAPHRLGA